MTTKANAPGGQRTERVGLPYDPELFDHMVEHGVAIEVGHLRPPQTPAAVASPYLGCLHVRACRRCTPAQLIVLANSAVMACTCCVFSGLFRVAKAHLLRPSGI